MRKSLESRKFGRNARSKILGIDESYSISPMLWISKGFATWLFLLFAPAGEYAALYIYGRNAIAV
jgi:hypothetical protein